MAVWLDIIGSFIFGSLLALNVMRMNADMTVQSYKGSLTYIAQGNVVTVAEILEDDIEKIGFGVSGTAITQADSSQLQALGDLNADGTVDTLRYYVGSPSEASSTQNPADRLLYRRLNSGAPEGIRLGITTFSLSYFNADGDSLALPPTPGDIRQIRIDLAVESAVPCGTTYAKAYMQLRIRPKNL